MRERVVFRHLGRIPYVEAWREQERLLLERVQLKLARRRGEQQKALPHCLLFCYHPPVITLSKRTDPSHLLSSEAELARVGIEAQATNRGGDITYHGPGQLVVYPIFDLECFGRDVHLYLRMLEEVVIDTLKEYGLEGERLEGLTGVWMPRSSSHGKEYAKIAAMGVRCSHWISMHGMAFNLEVELSHFDHIVPCGISGRPVTSLHELLGSRINLQEVEDKLLAHLMRRFDIVPFCYLPKK